MEASGSKFGKIVNDVKELRPSWARRLEIGLMDVGEFQEVLLTFIRQNLHAVISEDVDPDKVIEQAGEYTQAEWRLIATQLVPLIDQELGPARGDEPRQFTEKVWDRMRNRWEKRQW